MRHNVTLPCSTIQSGRHIYLNFSTTWTGPPHVTSHAIVTWNRVAQCHVSREHRRWLSQTDQRGQKRVGSRLENMKLPRGPSAKQQLSDDSILPRIFRHAVAVLLPSLLSDIPSPASSWNSFLPSYVFACQAAISLLSTGGRMAPDDTPHYLPHFVCASLFALQHRSCTRVVTPRRFQFHPHFFPFSGKFHV